jgi:2-polyprenyl-3-methyl-5-hydroxy-6-metoxy-1,4-benzoquinol methylase
LLGDELALSPDIGLFEKLYITVFGVPINGLRIRLRRILPVIEGSPRNILDAGCGRAVFSFQLARKFPDATVIGVDMDTEQLAVNRRIAERAGLSNVVFSNMDVACLEYVEKFDLVLSVDNLEHIEDDDKALAHLSAAIKNGGRLILHVPGYERRWFFFNFRRNFEVPGHFRPGYRLVEICRKVERTGLLIRDAYHTYGWLETVSNNFSYLITRAEAKNKMMYAVIFPLLNLLAWLGRKSRPDKGAGILIVAEKSN